MLTSTARPKLQALATDLARATAAVPPRARRFHRRRGELEAQVRALLARRLPWTEEGALIDLAEACAPLRAVEADLGRLCRQAESVEAEIGRLAERTSELADPAVAAWLCERTAAWSAALSRLGVDCERPFETKAELEAAGLIEEEVRRSDEALRWLLRAEAVLARLGSDLAAASLAADLPQLKRRLLAQGAGRDWVEALQSGVVPLEERAREVHDPPPALNTLSSVLPDLWGWSNLLGIEEATVERLEERRNFFARDWRNRPAAEIDALVAEAKELRARIYERAQDERRRRERELEDGMADLFQACGSQPELVSRMVALKARKADRSQLFETWQAAWTEEQSFFRAIATTHRGALEGRLSELGERLRRELADLRARPLSDAVRSAADRLDQKVKGLGRRTAVEDVLEDLRRAGELVHQVGDLARTAEGEAADLAGLRAENDAGETALAEAAKATGIALPALSAAPPDDGPAPSLEAARQREAARAAERARREAAFVEQCRQTLAAIAADLETTRKVLLDAGADADAAGTAPAGPLPHAAAAAATVASAAATVRAGHACAAELQAEVDRRLDAAFARRDALATALAGLSPEALGPREATIAAGLAAELAAGSWSQAATPRECLSRLARTTARADLFLDGLEREEREAVEGLADLLRRLAAFEEEQLTAFCPPALVARVTALAYGPRPRPRRWRDVHHQVQLARTLLDRLDTHARRRAAAEVESAAAALRTWRLSGTERTAADALLADLDRRGHDDLPPLLLRLKLRQAAQGHP